MRYRLLICVLALVFMSLSSPGQTEKDPKQPPDSIEIIINSQRRQILDKTEDKNYAKVREILASLTSLADSRKCEALYFSENLYLYLLLEDWIKLTDLMSDYKTLTIRPVCANSSEMVKSLQNLVLKSFDSIHGSCRRTLHDEETRQVFEILFQWIRSGEDDVYNNMIGKFRSDFRDSKYDDFIKGFLPAYKIRKSASIGLNGGRVAPMGQFNKCFEGGIAAGLSLDVNIERFFASVYLDRSRMVLDKALDDPAHIFSVGTLFVCNVAGLKGGYSILRNNHLLVAPFLTLNKTSMYQNWWMFDSSENGYEVYNSTGYGVGLHSEIKLKKLGKDTFPYYYSKQSTGFISLKVEAGYEFKIDDSEEYAKGNTEYFMVGINIGLGTF